MTKKKPIEQHLKRGPKPKPKPYERRKRAKSPYLVTDDRGLAKIPAAERNRMFDALDALPQPEASTSLVTTRDLPVVLPGVRTELTTAQIDRALTLLTTLAEKDVSEYAENSRRGMQADWRHWIAFCARQNRVAMPISFEDISTFVDGLIRAGYKRASIEHHLFTLKACSELWSCPSPVDTIEWKAFWRDRCRTRLSKRQYQAPGLNRADLREVADETDVDDPRALRDWVFAAVAYDMMARASELVSMKWANIDFSDPDGGATYVLERSKTDQEGRGASIYLSPRTVALLHRWNEHRFPENPFVFHALPRYEGQALDRERPLSVREVTRILDRVSRKTGLNKPLSGHSGRVGKAQDLTRAGRNLPDIMQAGRWKSPQMPARYAELESTLRAGKDREAALLKLDDDEAHRKQSDGK